LITRYADLTATQLVARTDHTFDAASRLTGLSHTQGATTLAAYTWGYDDADRVTQFVSATDGTATYSYDFTDQVTGAGYTYQTNESHTYDLNGNRTGGGYATALNNQTTSDGTYTYQYDGEGNRTRRTHIVTGAVTEYTWDHRNRLTAITERASATGPITARFEYTYDALNRRIAKSLDTNGDGTEDDRTYFVTDGLRTSRDNAGDHIVLTLDAAGAVTHRYLHGPAVDQILADEDFDAATGTSAMRWPLTDNQGTTRDVAEYNDATGGTAIANHLTYSAFGKVTSESNAAVDQLYTYIGRELDHESGFLHLRARPYDPDLAQFVGEDPEGFGPGDPNLRRYVGNNAANATDPSGLHEPNVPQSMLMRDGSVRPVSGDIDPIVEAQLRGLGGASRPVTSPHYFNSGVATPIDLVDDGVRVYLADDPLLGKPTVSGGTLRGTIDAGLTEITSRNAEWPPTTVFADGDKKYLLVPDFQNWGYNLAAKPEPDLINSRVIAEFYVHDRVTIANYQTADAVGTLVLHVIPGGAAADHFSQDGIGSKQAWLAVGSDVGAFFTMGGTKWVRIVGMTAEGAVIAVSSYDAGKNIADGKYAVAMGDLGQIMLHATIMRGGLKGLRADFENVAVPASSGAQSLINPSMRSDTRYGLNFFRTSQIRSEMAQMPAGRRVLQAADDGEINLVFDRGIPGTETAPPAGLYGQVLTNGPDAPDESEDDNRRGVGRDNGWDLRM
jgi:RHS repeat-associated protein